MTPAPRAGVARRYAARAPMPPPGLDLLRVPVLGRVLKWRHSRALLQVPLVVLSLVVVLHGLLGPQLAPKNLATLVTWVHYRGVLVLALVALGNVFCAGCPFVFVRDVARRVRAPRRAWPRALRNKWTAVAGFVAVLFLYEWLDLWGDPAGTALLVLGYFAACLAVDALFRDAPFCKWVCPLGQFNFAASTASPFEVRARDLDVCARCRTKDCIRGRRDASGAVTRRGCELALFLPVKRGNLDCTFCLDCVHACPYDNVAISARLPTEELWSDPPRSGVGRVGRRTDLAALGVLFVFGALLNAFAMVSPVYALQSWLAGAMGVTTDGPVLAALFVAGLVVEPAGLLLLAAWATRRAARLADSPFRIVVRYAWSLVPLGLGVWTAHYLFHFLTGIWTVVPVAQHTLERLGAPFLGRPDWSLGGLPESAALPIEMGFLALGAMASWAVAWRTSAEVAPGSTFRAALPWLVLHALLAAAAVWLLLQPMEMRGTFLG